MKKRTVIILLVVLVTGSLAGGYWYFTKHISQKNPQTEEAIRTTVRTEDLFTLRLYYPVHNRLQMEERKLPRRNKEIAIAETIVEEFLKGPSGAQVSSVPGNTRLLGIYKDTERVFYIELSEEFRRNFQGDALTEYFVLKGLYESLISNIPDLQDVKVLIEGREAETLGGHLYLSYPLKDMISYENE